MTPTPEALLTARVLMKAIYDAMLINSTDAQGRRVTTLKQEEGEKVLALALTEQERAITQSERRFASRYIRTNLRREWRKACRARADMRGKQ